MDRITRNLNRIIAENPERFHFSISPEKQQEWLEKGKGWDLRPEAIERARAGEEAAKHIKIVPMAAMTRTFGVPYRNETQGHTVEIGVLQFWVYHHDGVDYVPLEDIALMLSQIGAAVDFGFLELGHDHCTLRPEHVFPGHFLDGDVEWTGKEMQNDAMLYLEHLSKLDEEREEEVTPGNSAAGA
jgi:hypothetical protein